MKEQLALIIVTTTDKFNNIASDYYSTRLLLDIDEQKKSS